ncbi:MAG: hypothetical protein HYV75_00195 [Opitutae bacterium]|nr:hypothetical protein [Opitutae bacterium]
MNWESLDWEALDRLRADFLSGAAANGPYWHTITDLECYDFTYGRRIAWKWDAVLDELKLRQWRPPAGGTVLDWGCGSGVAGRRVIECFGPENFSRLAVHDHSALAMDFAEHHGRLHFPSLEVARATPRLLAGEEPIGVLVLSHVLNELHDTDLTGLGKLMNRAASILWVEPGNHEVSRVLGHWRKKLVGPLRVVAPCTHHAACGVLAAGNEQHWCHFFAAVPAGIHADSGWVRFGQRAGIDLRSLPYCFLSLDRRPAGAALDAARPGADERRPYPEQPGYSRVIGEPRHYKGYAKVYSCDAAGVTDLTLQKRDAPDVFKALKRAAGPMLYRWTHVNGRITGVEPPA